MAGDNPLTRDIRTALGKGQEAAKFGGELPAITPEETPRIFRGSYGIGSRDFRPEHTLGAYEFATGGKPSAPTAKAPRTARPISRWASDHPYAVISKDTPSLLPRRRDRGAVPLDRRLGDDHHRQKPWRDHRQLWPDHFRAHPDL